MVSPTQLCWRYHSLPLRQRYRVDLIEAWTKWPTFCRLHFSNAFSWKNLDSVFCEVVFKCTEYSILHMEKANMVATPYFGENCYIMALHYFDGVVQNCRNSVANTLELPWSYSTRRSNMFWRMWVIVKQIQSNQSNSLALSLRPDVYTN